jgi:hypothetical protein
LLFVVCVVSARGDFREFHEVPTDQRLESALKSTVEITLKEFPKLTADDLAISVVELWNHCRKWGARDGKNSLFPDS